MRLCAAPLSQPLSPISEDVRVTSVLRYGTSLDIRFSPTKYCLFKIGKDFSKNVPAVCIDGQNICLVEHSYIFKYVQCVQKNIHYCFLAYSEKKEPI